jgi:two-component system sensor histidine kinase ChiS
METKPTFNRIPRRSVSAGCGARQASPTVGSNPVILCVDDEPDLLTILRLFLSAQDLEVIPASDAAEALSVLEQRRPDLIITDYAMPGMSGLELCRTLRDRADTCEIPIILYSGRDLWQDDYPRLFDRFVLKPAEFDVFIRTVRALLAAPRARQLPRRGSGHRRHQSPK